LGDFYAVRIVHISTVLTLRAHQCTAADADFWAEGVSQEYRKLPMINAVEKTEVVMAADGKSWEK
jgi:hypothetical protein